MYSYSLLFPFIYVSKLVAAFIVKNSWQFQLLDNKKWKPAEVKQIKRDFFIILNENILDMLGLCIKKKMYN